MAIEGRSRRHDNWLESADVGIVALGLWLQFVDVEDFTWELWDWGDFGERLKYIRSVECLKYLSSCLQISAPKICLKMTHLMSCLLHASSLCKTTDIKELLVSYQLPFCSTWFEGIFGWPQSDGAIHWDSWTFFEDLYNVMPRKYIYCTALLIFCISFSKLFSNLFLLRLEERRPDWHSAKTYPKKSTWTSFFTILWKFCGLSLQPKSLSLSVY